MNRALLLISVAWLVAIIGMSSSVYAVSQSELVKKINSVIEPDLSAENVKQIDKLINGSWNSVDQVSYVQFTNSSALNNLSFAFAGNATFVPIIVNGTVVNGTQVPPPPKPIEICGDGIDNDGDGQVDEGCPPPKPTDDKPSVDVNTTKTLRLGVVGDVDLNSGLDKQISIFKKYNVDTVIIPGDYGYNDCQKVVDKLQAADFNNLIIAEGNHDCAAITKKVMQKYNFNNTWGQVHLTPQVDIYSLDANKASDFDCNSAQFKTISDQIMSSDAWYKFAVTHQPFVTVKSTHGDNGQFQCWNPVFAGNGVNGVLDAHNHNYQRIDAGGIHYGLFGTGTHDTGSSMYPLNSKDWNGNPCIKCMTGTNGVVLLDLQIDNPALRVVNGWFLDNSENVKDKFTW